MANMNQRKKVKTFQAGYSGGNSWNACGYGKTKEEARKKLNNIITAESIKSIIRVMMETPKQPDGYYSMPTSETLLRWFYNHKRMITEGQYIKQSSEDYEEA